ncbi:uncharacterized protein EI90DRAFT_1771352 [Cantharellus anzutake]|uniref:uncharacterized protein n=1 Tax=Cantharellus anzutake TaxID=1750568 RepID=UPI001903D6D5|nr:uncharacterized protein EI90DRAFT_1771352 [Cantharellus anzutake]KAF8327601.1 hypothetical protein EI90DRAFT_1771352 [Cantharellus anzutake]
MMMFTPVAFLLCLLTLVTASPIEKRIVPISKSTGHKLSLSSHNVLSFGKKDLHVDFQSCQPNFGHWDGKNSTPVGGHLVVKSTGKCLTIKTPYTSPPFTVTTEPCYYSDDSGQTFSNFIEGNGRKIYFVGK